MGAQSSKPEQHVTPTETTFFANREQTPVKFDDTLLTHLTSTSSTSLPASRQSTLDSHIQAKLAAELARLQAQEADVRRDIAAALEKENIEAETKAAKEKGVLHSASLKESLGRLEERVKALKAESGRGKGGEGWKKVEGEREGLVACFLANKTTPLNCKEAADKFRSAVAEVEKSFVTAL